MKNMITLLWAKLAERFVGERGKETVEAIVRNTPRAMPYIEWAASITPTGIDDIALRWMRERYPRFFNGQPLTDDEMKLLRFVFASERLAEDNALDKSTGRAAVSNAFAIRKAEQAK